MRPRADVDPELHALRMAFRGHNDLERARFHLYAAFEARDSISATRWLRTIRIGVDLIDLGAAKPLVLDVLSTIEVAIDPEKKERSSRRNV